MTTWTIYTGDPAKDVPTLSTFAPPFCGVHMRRPAKNKAGGRRSCDGALYSHLIAVADNASAC